LLIFNRFSTNYPLGTDSTKICDKTVPHCTPKARRCVVIDLSLVRYFLLHSVYQQQTKSNTLKHKT